MLFVKELTDIEIALIKNNFPVIIGKHLRTVRKKRNITQSQLAEATGKDRQYIYKIEKGKVTINLSTFYIILKALELSFDEFFEDFE